MATNKLSSEQKKLRRRIIDLSFERNLSHIGSCLSAIDILDAIYKIKKKSEKFVLSNGHSGIALYTVLEKYKILKPSTTNRLNIHPDRNNETGIDVSTGSLGHGLPIALGMAFANKNKNVFCLISDGECTEGSVWETLRIISNKKVSNLKIVLNANGWGAYDAISLNKLYQQINAFNFEFVELDGHNLKKMIQTLSKKNKKPLFIFARTNSDQFPFLKGQDAHYYIMNSSDYKLAKKILL